MSSDTRSQIDLLVGWGSTVLILVSVFLIVPGHAQGQVSRPVQEEEIMPWEEVPPEEDQEEEPEPGVAEEDAEPELRLDRISFEVPFPPEKGGGVAIGTAGNLEYVRDDYVVASGGVELRFRDYIFQGERVAVDLKEEQITAEGDVILDQGPQRMVGDTLFFDLKSEQGTLSNAKAFVDPEIYFEGREITRLAPDRYRVIDGRLTSCLDDTPDWNFKLSRAEVELDGFAKLKHARFRVKKLPLLYSPYILYPARTERASGFLFPNFGYSNNRGFNLGLAYFRTLGPSADTTFFADFYGKDYFGLGNEWRYRPSPYTSGFFEGYVIDDPNQDELRWKVFFMHKSDRLPLGLKAAIRYQDFSDFDFFRDFERDFNNATVRRLLSSGFLTGSWGQHSSSLVVDQNETFVKSDDIATTRRLPKFEYRLRAYQLFRLPVYVDMVSSLANLQSERTDSFDENWQRGDLFPALRASLSTLPWLSWSINGGGRITQWSKSVDRETDELVGEELTRTYATASSSLVGPSFSRVFDKDIGRFDKFKHIVEPRWFYLFVDDFEDADLIPRFDEVDRIQDFNVVSYNLVNRLLAKPKDEAGGGAREIMSMEISQQFSLDNERPLQEVGAGETLEQTTRGPINFRYRFNPSRRASLEARVQHNTLTGRLANTSLTSAVGLGVHGVGLTWFTRYNKNTGDTTGNQVRFFSGIGLWPGRLRLDMQLNYDFNLSLLQSQRYVLQYFAQCWGIRLEFREFESGVQETRDFRFALTLKNIGTFLDLTGGSANGFSPGF